MFYIFYITPALDLTIQLSLHICKFSRFTYLTNAFHDLNQFHEVFLYNSKRSTIEDTLRFSL